MLSILMRSKQLASRVIASRDMSFLLIFGERCRRSVRAPYTGLCEFAVADLPIGVGFGADGGAFDRLVGAVVGDCEIFAVGEEIVLRVSISLRL
jgi:hypothetical protein